ncbi:pantoate kinase [Archaeoglobus fulgidus]|uniref:Pantoate kinase n=1 Tax=Archaeoglobus fulgidus DSM 8774 TaxID=1344584 RepID=A0A075WHL2_ARCFL|nr:pantoate kinase [Archaeoglobus fulgidus]AIG98649.1 putative archaeal kinase (sugar kinase superfamily) [Archaeoglobus fulgidus DSM 8774]
MIFAPASITCIFSPHVDSNPKNSGSIGVGFTIERGLQASLSTKTTINGEEWSFPTLDDVLEKVGLEGVAIKASLPFGCGFGMSGAAALATAVLGNLGYIEAADIAHVAEVENFTGLGDVVTQTFGGVVVRKSAACPSRAELERFFWNAEFDFVVMGEISTKGVIGDELKRRRIGEAGKRWTKEFLKKPTLENLFHCSNGFARETGLLELVGDAVEAVESAGGKAAMVMLGKTVFAVNGFEALKEFGEPFKARLDCCGVRRL